MVGTDYYKIGYTGRIISKRLSEIQVGCPGELRVYDTYKSDIAPQIELALHNKLAPKRSNGEWFILDSTDLSNFKNQCKKAESSILALMESDNPFIKRK